MMTESQLKGLINDVNQAVRGSETKTAMGRETQKSQGSTRGSTLKTCLRADRNLNTTQLTTTNNKYNVM